MWLLSCSVMTNSLWPHELQHTRLHCPSLSPGVAQTHVHWVNHAIQPSHVVLSPSPPVFNLSQHQGLGISIHWVSPLHQVVKVLDFSFSISPSNEYSGLISLRIDWFDPLAVQGTLKSLLSTTVWRHQFFSTQPFFIVQLSHWHMTTGKTTALTIWTFSSKIMSLLFNMPSRFVITFLPRSEHLLISWLQSPSAVILEPNKVCHCFHCFPIYLPWRAETGCHDLHFLNVEF